MKNRYKISELAKITNISNQTLIFYHKKEILIPEYIDTNNGYRYYSSSQIWDLFFIITLKKAGFSLEDIKNYTKVKEPIKNIKFLEEKIVDIDKKIKELKNNRNIIKEKISCFKEISSNLEEKVEIVIRKSMRVYFIKIKNPFDQEEIAQTYDKLEKLGNKNNIKDIIYVLKIKKNNIDSDSEIPINKIGILLPDEFHLLGEEFLEEKLCVKLRHKSTFDMIKLSYKILYQFIENNNYKIVDDFIEIGNEVVIPLENGFGGVVDIYIPIKKIY